MQIENLFWLKDHCTSSYSPLAEKVPAGCLLNYRYSFFFFFCHYITSISKFQFRSRKFNTDIDDFRSSASVTSINCKQNKTKLK